MKECCREYLDGQFGGDQDVVAEIYSEYVSSMKEKAAEAEAALAAGDWDRLDKAAHTMKGNALMSGDTDTAAIAIGLREEAKLKDRAAAEASMAKIKEAVAGL